MQAIRNEGNVAEARFLKKWPAATKPPRQKDGDWSIVVDGVQVCVEVKKCAAGAGEGGTINQIRAIKYIPMLVFNPTLEIWVVVPAAELVRRAAGKQRGQHTEISFESMNLSFRDLAEFGCSEENLIDAVIAAVRFDREHRILQVAMVALAAQIRRVADRAMAEAGRLADEVPHFRLPCG